MEFDFVLDRIESQTNADTYQMSTGPKRIALRNMLAIVYLARLPLIIQCSHIFTQFNNNY